MSHSNQVKHTNILSAQFDKPQGNASQQVLKMNGFISAEEKTQRKSLKVGGMRNTNSDTIVTE